MKLPTDAAMFRLAWILLVVMLFVLTLPASCSQYKFEGLQERPIPVGCNYKLLKNRDEDRCDYA